MRAVAAAAVDTTLRYSLRSSSSEPLVVFDRNVIGAISEEGLSPAFLFDPKGSGLMSAVVLRHFMFFLSNQLIDQRRQAPCLEQRMLEPASI